MSARVGDLTASRARFDGAAVELIQDITKLDNSTVLELLVTAHGKKLVRNIFGEDWPTTAGALGDLRVRQARYWGLIKEIAKIASLSPRKVEQRLAEVHGSITVKTAFEAEWPAEKDELEEELEDGAADEEDDDERGDEKEENDKDEEEDGLSASPILRALRLDPGGEWSRPRRIDRVLRTLGMEVPQRLRAQRFREAIRELSQMGVELRIEDNSRSASALASSPGISASVRLRRACAKAQADRPTTTAAALTSPPIVVVAKPPPVVAHTPEHAGSGYELALLRLQFLTALPSMDRQRDPEWPARFLAVAMESLSLAEQERRLLQTVALSFVRGAHSPCPLIRELVKAARLHDLNGLLREFRYLNRHMPEATEQIVRDVEEDLVRMHGVSGAHAPSPYPAPGAPPAQHPDRSHPEPLAASAYLGRDPASGDPGGAPRRRAPPAPAPPAVTRVKSRADEGRANVRDLGPLGDMFGDEER